MRTIDVEVVWATGMKTFSKKAARQALGIKTRTTFNEDLKALGLWGKARLTLQDLTEIFKLKVYLSARPGVNSRVSYAKKRRFPLVLESEMRLCGVNFNQSVENFRNAIG